MTYIDPALPVCVLLLLLSAVVGWRRRVPGRHLWVLAAAGLFLWSWPPVAWLLAATLESPYPARFLPQGEAQAIVVLSGGLQVKNASRAAVRLAENSAIRTAHAAWLHHNWRPLPILASGGPHMGDPQLYLAEEMARTLRSLGVPPGQIWLESRSTSTYQNAVYSARILRIRGIRRIVLVTEGYHMLRAELCFRKQGIDVIAAPTEFHSKEYSTYPPDYIPNSRAIRYNDQVLHEWVGLLVYWLKGRI